MAEITAANALSVAAKAIEGVRAKLAEERAARLKAEGERDTVAKRLEFFLSVDTAGSGWCGEHPRMYSMRPGEEADGECLACQVEAAEARLRAVIEAADGLAIAWENRASMTVAIAAYRRVRDAQASPEPEASKHGGRDAE